MTQGRIAPNHQIVSLQTSESLSQGLTESPEPPTIVPMAAIPSYGDSFECKGTRKDPKVESGHSSMLASTHDVVVTIVRRDGSGSYNVMPLTDAGNSIDTCFPLVVQDLSDVILKMKREAKEDGDERRQLQAELHMLRQKNDALQGRLNGQFAAHRRANQQDRRQPKMAEPVDVTRTMNHPRGRGNVE